jgi:hypothetical protein
MAAGTWEGGPHGDDDVLLSYDARGGYGHRDHVKVHQVGARAAKMTGARVLAAMPPRELV